MKRERQRCGWSQADLSNRLRDNGLTHIQPSTIAKIEQGKRDVRLDEAQVLADLFGVSVDAMLGRTPLDDGVNLANEKRLARHTATSGQLAIQDVQQSLASAAVALFAVAGFPATDDDAETIATALREASTALADVDRRLGAALAATGGLAR